MNISAIEDESAISAVTLSAHILRTIKELV